MTVKIKIFCSTPKELEKQVNIWIRDTKMSPMKIEDKQSGFQVLHTHVIAMPPKKICIVFFYKEFP